MLLKPTNQQITARVKREIPLDVYSYYENLLINEVENRVGIRPVVKFNDLPYHTFGTYDTYTMDITLNQNYKGCLNQLFTLRHELQHFIQGILDPELLKDYVDGEEDYEAYINHPCEVDANDQAERWFKSVAEALAPVVKRNDKYINWFRTEKQIEAAAEAMLAQFIPMESNSLKECTKKEGVLYMLLKPKTQQQMDEAIVHTSKVPVGEYVGKYLAYKESNNKNGEAQCTLELLLTEVTDGTQYKMRHTIQAWEALKFVAELYAAGYSVESVEDVAQQNLEVNVWITHDKDFPVVHVNRPFPVRGYTVGLELDITIGKFQYFEAINPMTGLQEEIIIQRYSHDGTSYVNVRTGKTSQEVTGHLLGLYSQVMDMPKGLVPSQAVKQEGKKAVAHIFKKEDTQAVYLRFGRSNDSIKAVMAANPNRRTR